MTKRQRRNGGQWKVVVTRLGRGDHLPQFFGVGDFDEGVQCMLSLVGHGGVPAEAMLFDAEGMPRAACLPSKDHRIFDAINVMYRAEEGTLILRVYEGAWWFPGLAAMLARDCGFAPRREVTPREWAEVAASRDANPLSHSTFGAIAKEYVYERDSSTWGWRTDGPVPPETLCGKPPVDYLVIRPVYTRVAGRFLADVDYRVSTSSAYVDVGPDRELVPLGAGEWRECWTTMTDGRFALPVED